MEREGLQAQAICFRRRHTTDPPTFDITVNNSVNTSPVSAVAPALTARCGDDLLAALIPDVSATGAFDSPTMPSGYTERETNETGFLVTSFATKENVPAGSTGTPTFAFNILDQHPRVRDAVQPPALPRVKGSFSFKPESEWSEFIAHLSGFQCVD